jgi:hypothetical protein
MNEYKIVESVSRIDLQKEINQLLAMGWKISGSLNTMFDSSTGYKRVLYIQAMIKTI